MPRRRRVAKGRVDRITPEAINAARARDDFALHVALCLKPWEATPLVARGACPPWAAGSAWAESWKRAQPLRPEFGLTARNKLEVETRGERNCRWIENECRIPEGRDVGQRVRLRAWQRREICRIYDNASGTRRALLSFGRKNGKTALAAFLLLLHLCGPEARPNAQLYSAAQSREQAAILFGLAAKVVRLSPTLAPHVLLRDTSKQLACSELGTLYRALSADATTAYGLSPIFIVHDELGQVKGPRSELYEALETATAAQEEPLSIIISTQAPTDADLLSVLIDDALAGHDPRVVVSLYTASPDVDAFSDEAIRAANPAFGDFQNAEEVRAMAEDARRMRSREPEYRNLVLNQRVEMRSPFVSRGIWNDCKATAPWTNFEHFPIYAGIDLSEVRDLTAMTLVADTGSEYLVRSKFWLPAEGIRERAQHDRVPYDFWAQQGHLTLVPGASVDYEFVAAEIVELFSALEFAAVGFDRWNWRHFRPCLERAGMSDGDLERFVEFGQGFQSMSPALRLLESAILDGKMRHDGNPVLTMCAANAVVQSDPAGNRKLTKAKSHGRIDGMVSLAIAFGVRGAAPEESRSVYSEIGAQGAVVAPAQTRSRSVYEEIAAQSPVERDPDDDRYW
jgi:phage terminase large subunit-like protein